MGSEASPRRDATSAPDSTGATNAASATNASNATGATIAPPSRRETILAAEYPELAASVPWLPLAHTPTPVEPCDAITGWLGRSGVWIKRDDRVSPLYGGNKVRRFEYLLADAAARGARELVTVGGLASTQVTATVLFGRAHGFGVRAVLFDQPLTPFVRRALLAGATAGGLLVHGGGYARTAWRTLGALRAADRPYFVAPGASGPIAILGYVDAMLELGEQVRRGEAPRPDVIVVPSGSGGTLAGLALGAAILGWPTRLVGVRITDLVACNRATIRLLVEATARTLSRRAPSFTRRRLPPVRFELFHGAIGEGYGHPTPEAREALPQVERLIGVPGEITYSGKGLVGLRAVAAAAPRATVLYWQTLSSRLPPADDEAAAALPEALRRIAERAASA